MKGGDTVIQAYKSDQHEIRRNVQRKSLALYNHNASNSIGCKQFLLFVSQLTQLTSPDSNQINYFEQREESLPQIILIPREESLPPTVLGTYYH